MRVVGMFISMCVLPLTYAQVVINEIVTQPRTDWSTNGFDGTDGLSTISAGVDEYLELYIKEAGLDLTNYQIELIDGTDVSGTVLNIFQTVNYTSNSGGVITNTAVGDYLVLGNVVSDGAMNNDVIIVLKDDLSETIDSVYLGTSIPSGQSTCVADEALSRYPNGVDTDGHGDFISTYASLGISNGVEDKSSSGYCAKFDGSNDYLSIATSPLETPTGITIEYWVNSSVAAGNAMSFSFEGGYFNRIYSNGDVQVVFDGSTAGSSQISAGINDGNWHHIASVNDGATTTVYVDGVSVGGQAETIFDVNSVDQPFTIGSQFDGTLNFEGSIDEFRVWNSALSQATIQDWMLRKVTSSHPDICSLQAYYKFDEFSGSTAYDYTHKHDLSFVNGATWSLSGASIGDDALCTTGSLNANVSLSHANGDNMTATITDGSASLLCIYRVDEAPITTSVSGGLVNVSDIDFYGVKLFGNSGGEYAVVYTYTGHPGIEDASELGLASRANNAASWSEAASAVLDTDEGSIFLGGQTGTQFILGSSSIINPLPVDFISVNAITTDDLVTLSWVTANEINSSHYEIEASNSLQDWIVVATELSSGESKNEYKLSFLNNYKYFRIKQVDYDGLYAYSKVVNVSQTHFSVSPNPVHDHLYLHYEGDIHDVFVTNSMGVYQNVKVLELEPSNFDFDFSTEQEGLYIVHTPEEEATIVKY